MYEDRPMASTYSERAQAAVLAALCEHGFADTSSAQELPGLSLTTLWQGVAQQTAVGQELSLRAQNIREGLETLGAGDPEISSGERAYRAGVALGRLQAADALATAVNSLADETTVQRPHRLSDRLKNRALATTAKFSGLADSSALPARTKNARERVLDVLGGRSPAFERSILDDISGILPGGGVIDTHVIDGQEAGRAEYLAQARIAMADVLNGRSKGRALNERAYMKVVEAATQRFGETRSHSEHGRRQTWRESDGLTLEKYGQACQLARTLSQADAVNDRIEALKIAIVAREAAAIAERRIASFQVDLDRFVDLYADSVDPYVLMDSALLTREALGARSAEFTFGEPIESGSQELDRIAAGHIPPPPFLTQSGFHREFGPVTL